MLTRDPSLAEGYPSTFSRVVPELLNYWERLSIICPETYRTRVVTQEKLQVWPASYGPGGALRVLKRASEAAALAPVDLVVAQDPLLPGLYGLVVARRLGCPVAMEVHGNYLDNPAWLGQSHKNPFWNLLAKRLVRHADRVRAVNRRIESYLRAVGVTKEHIAYAPSCYVETKLLRDLARPRNLQVLYVGRLEKEKGLDLLLQSFELVTRELPEARLTVLGNGGEFDHLTFLVEKAGLMRHVQFLREFAGPDALLEHYNASAVLAITSWYEGGPRVAFEALACGTPIVSTRVGLVEELVVDGREGFVTERNPRDIAHSMVLLLRDEKLRRIMGLAGRELVKAHCEWKSAIRRYAEAYLSVAR